MQIQPPMDYLLFQKRRLVKSGDFGTPTLLRLNRLIRCLISFSPLSGILVIKQRLLSRPYTENWRVSVPFRGFWYSDDYTAAYNDDGNVRFSPLSGILVIKRLNFWFGQPSIVLFQSPYGDFGNQTTEVDFTREKTGKFQSPYGDFGNQTA